MEQRENAMRRPLPASRRVTAPQTGNRAFYRECRPICPTYQPNACHTYQPICESGAKISWRLFVAATVCCNCAKQQWLSCRCLLREELFVFVNIFGEICGIGDHGDKFTQHENYRWS